MVIHILVFVFNDFFLILFLYLFLFLGCVCLYSVNKIDIENPYPLKFKIQSKATTNKNNNKISNLEFNSDDSVIVVNYGDTEVFCVNTFLILIIISLFKINDNFKSFSHNYNYLLLSLGQRSN